MIVTPWKIDLLKTNIFVFEASLFFRFGGLHVREEEL